MWVRLGKVGASPLGCKEVHSILIRNGQIRPLPKPLKCLHDALIGMTFDQLTLDRIGNQFYDWIFLKQLVFSEIQAVF